jgi:D-lactate dehydrogenase
MLTGKYHTLYENLTRQIDASRIYHDPLHTLAFGTDASFYRLIPQMVIKAKDENEISFLLKEAHKLAIAVTFRAGGTSLSGQAISDSVLVIAGEEWRNYEILDEGKKIKLQPGLRGLRVNQLLAPYNRKIGPDPASIQSALIGGIAANNASGMCCGTSDNSYQTVSGMRIIFHDGALLDTSDTQSKTDFQQSHPHIIENIMELSRLVKSNESLSNRIHQKFKIKNTTGYSLNALVDFTDPFDIIEHLMIGSEGTLGFIAEITYRTVPEYPYRANALIIFPDNEKACQAVVLLKSSPVSAAELIDRAGIRSVENEKGMPPYLVTLSDHACAILVETQAEQKELLFHQIETIRKDIEPIEVEIPYDFTDVPAEYALLWKIRKGMFPSVGAMRKTGTTVIIEDVAFPLGRLAEAIHDLRNLFDKYRYSEAVIFGHALDGNLHFVFTQDFSNNNEIERYEKLMNEVANLVVDKYDGSLKAEHGTGRNMAPFVEKEWGKEAFQIMKQIKLIFDPQNLLNPGVILNPDPKAHLKNLKPLPPANEKVDKCIECGFCAPSCVSAELTLTPRQRIALYREIKRLQLSAESPHMLASLIKGYGYQANETCATDGLCAISCPVKIDTGKLIKEIRYENHTFRQQKTAMWVATHMAFVTSMARITLTAINFVHLILGTTLMKKIAMGLRKFSGHRIPLWTAFMPSGAKPIQIKRQHSDNPKKVVYFPSCINRSMGVSKDYNEEVQVSQKMLKLLQKGGYEVLFPENLNQLCCGMAFLSKGFKEAGLKKTKELEMALRKASNNGEYAILCDMSPCLFTMKENIDSSLKLYEPIEFILDFLLPELEITPIDETISVFPVCSTKKMGLENKLLELAKMCASEVIIPETNCCGFAGDRGFSYPELNKHGLRYLKEQLPPEIKNGYSTSRTCEIGISFHSGISHKSIIYLVDQVTRSRKK